MNIERAIKLDIVIENTRLAKAPAILGLGEASSNSATLARSWVRVQVIVASNSMRLVKRVCAIEQMCFRVLDSWVGCPADRVEA